ncbi:hypothetical protein MVES_001136 [Malassezia vespertilionis]|uniref:DNA-directed RNA polymerase III subunit RPC9 n=1 Tax=Malassezia vespertilionis TaxID=2020962 RepID=A0A2N1JEU3_9BASI|nr:hypothetical protein MVES_001136 [Malassezia vespertilionis]
MRVVQKRAALLSDFEVYTLLREAEQKQRADSSARRSDRAGDWTEETIPPNVRTVQFETIASLSQQYRPCRTQSVEAIRGFLDTLAEQGFVPPDARILRGERGLTKGERLQLVNHAPTSVLVEELGERFSDAQIEQILALVRHYFPPPAPTSNFVAKQDGVQDNVQDGVQDTLIQDTAIPAQTAPLDETQAYMDEDAFPEEHFEHEAPGAAQDDGEEHEDI